MKIAHSRSIPTGFYPETAPETAQPPATIRGLLRQRKRRRPPTALERRLRAGVAILALPLLLTGVAGCSAVNPPTVKQEFIAAGVGFLVGAAIGAGVGAIIGKYSLAESAAIGAGAVGGGVLLYEQQRREIATVGNTSRGSSAP